MKNLPATEEMLAVAREDVPVKVGSGWNTFYRCRYSGFVRSAVEGGILKVTLYDPDAMRLGGTLPVYADRSCQRRMTEHCGAASRLRPYEIRSLEDRSFDTVW